jgi:hypothetical protein
MTQAENAPTTKLLRRHAMSLIASSAAVPAASTIAIALPAADADPIFAVIADHRAAIEAMNAAWKISGALKPGPEFEAADAVSTAASRREYEARLPVLTMQPTTMAGVAALLDHVQIPCRNP